MKYFIMTNISFCKSQILKLFFSVLTVFLIISCASSKITTTQKESSAQELYNKGKLQRAAWKFSEEMKFDRALEVHLEIEKFLLESAIDTIRTNSKNELPGSSDAFRIYFQNSSISGVFKKAFGNDKENIKFERAAYLYNRELRFNFVPTVVIRSIKIEGETIDGSIMYWIEGSLTAEKAGLDENDRSDLLRFFDAIIGNIDRKEDNWLVDHDGRIIAIDHDLGFTPGPSFLGLLGEVKDLKAIKKTEPFQRFQNLKEPQFNKLLKELSVSTKKEIWHTRNWILNKIQNETKS